MNHYKLHEGLDVLPYYIEIHNEENSSSWKGSRHSTHKETTTIELSTPLRVAEFKTYPHTEKFLAWFIETYGGIIGNASYIGLPAEGNVPPHSDRRNSRNHWSQRRPYGPGRNYGEATYYEEYPDRFHFVVCGKYQYTVNEEMQEYEAGDLWWFPNNLFHSAYNHGDIERISLIFDVKNCNWRDSIV
tara:strand:- start:148 stop:708 length:561 start_codon:yes stop_codon:yes gene_type:complete